MDNHNNASGNGAGKKFLYTGPKKKSAFGDEDEVQHWSYNTNTHNNTQNRYNASKEFDMESIWSIKKNIDVQKGQQSNKATNSATDGWDRNVGKGFYSRHGGTNNSEIRTSASPVASPSGKTWPRTHNYSYTTSGRTGSSTNGPSSNRDFMKFDSGQASGRSPNTDRYNTSAAKNGDNSVHQGIGSNASHFDF